MPASQGFEELLLEAILAKKEVAAKKAYLGLSTLKPSELVKKTTAKEFGEKEPTEATEWIRLEVDTIEWTKTKGELETGATIWENKNAIKGAGGAGEFKKLKAGSAEYLLETFAILEKAKPSEDAAESKGIYVFGKLTTKFTVGPASEVNIAAGALKIECE